MSCEKRFHLLYCTWNKVNLHYYIGRHSTNNLKDGYLGSGSRLKAAITKHGKENFRRLIISFCDSYEDVVQQEIDILTEWHIQNPACYNISGGGHGGYLSEETYKRRVVKHTDADRQRISESKIGVPRPDIIERWKQNGIPEGMLWTGKTRTVEDRNKKSEVAKINVENGKIHSHKNYSVLIVIKLDKVQI